MHTFKIGDWIHVYVGLKLPNNPNGVIRAVAKISNIRANLITITDGQRTYSTHSKLCRKLKTRNKPYKYKEYIYNVEKDSWDKIDLGKLIEANNA